MHAINKLLTTLRQSPDTPVTVSGLRGSALAMLVGRAAADRRPVLCVVPTEQQVPIVEQDIALFTDIPVVSYPGYDIPPYTPLSPDPVTIASRLSALYHIVTADRPFILVASGEALLRRVLPKDRLTALAELVISGEETDQNGLVDRLVEGGYEPVSLVQTVGEFSVRGGILDIYPAGFDYPVRLDFFGDTVESIRHFDPITQRSVEEVAEIVLLPVSDVLFPPSNHPAEAEPTARLRQYGEQLGWDVDEMERIAEQIANRRRFPGIEFFLPLFYPALSTPLDFLPQETLTFLLDPLEMDRSINLVWERIEANHREAVATASPVLPPESVFMSAAQLDAALKARPLVRITDFPEARPEEGASPGRNHFQIPCGNHTLLKQDLELQRKKSGLLTPLANYIDDWLQQGDRIVFACRTARHARHLGELLGQHHLPTQLKDSPVDFTGLPRDAVTLFGQPLDQGFDLPEERLHILSESELFGEKRLGSRKKTREQPRGRAVSFEELQAGAIVVHQDHGLGVYQGIVNLELHGLANDFLTILYQGDDKLFVPVDRINTVSKYKGVTDRQPKLDKLGGKVWTTTKKKVKEEVWKVALELLDLYARRQLEKARAFSAPDELFHELEESFPFDETPGQSKAINAVIDDLVSESPMDRLVCGDVGYGKTEVAIRAAFKVVEDNHQAAVLVPTTVLAEQHAATFRDRFEGFPVRVESLNRFRTPADQRVILKDLAEGRIDVVIGTHRLLSKDVIFKRLGLLIIDEEHRFGVTHKEKLKKLRARVDVLTLTATPIPRTLQLSLLGVRDLSVISSPPAHRRTVKTFVARHDDLVIKEAVSRELQRGGQVFLVHNRVRSIHDVARRVQKLTPQARVAVAHGQMPGKHLEEIMVRFVSKEVDVLVCTTIIESGLDIPNANTIIITRADRLGMAEIYQLRGRVGRSSEQAYAYLLVPSLDGLSKDARQRLRALMDYNELGGGFKLAMSDLQIRGGGNILGESQSGNIAAVGYDLYLDLLQKTVEDLKRKSAGGEAYLEEEEVEPEINLRISAYIPEHFISDPNQRYIAYKKITSLDSEDELLDLQDELRDRYGSLPQETDNLFDIVALKLELKKMKISKLEQGQSTLVFTFLDRTPVSPGKILALVKKSKNTIRFTPDSKLVVPAALDSPASTLEAAKKVLHAIIESDK